MSNPQSQPASMIAAQLQGAVKVTKVRWAAWLRLAGNQWIFPLMVNISKARQAALIDFISDQHTSTWLAGAFSSGRMRSRQTISSTSPLGCKRIYVFPNLQEHCALLVGADGLEKSAENLFRVLAWNAPVDESPPPKKGKRRLQVPTPVDQPSPDRREVEQIVFAETARDLQQLALLNEMASAAAMGVDTHEVPRRVMARLRSTFHTDRARLYLISFDRKTLLEYGSEKERDQLAAIPVEKSLLGTVVEAGMPLRSGDIHNFWAGADPLGFLANHRDMHSVLVVPLKYQETVIGALELQSLEGNAFTLQDEQLLVFIARHLAGLFENMRLNAETRERAQKLRDSVRQLHAVRETALDISGNLDLDTLLQRVVHRARELVDARGAEIGFLEEKKGMVRILASDSSWLQTRVNSVPLEVDVAGRVAAYGEPLVVNDYNSWNARLFPEREAPYRVVAGVPLKFQDQVIGVLAVRDDRPGKVFRPEDIQLLELLAPLVTVWIRNARLYQELQERIEAQQLAENHLIQSTRLAAVGEMAAGVAHELNNPLTTVSGFVELVLDELPDDSPHRPDLELVLREAQRAAGVVRSLLDFSRPAENQHVRTDLNELVGDVLTLIQHLVRTGGVEMHIELWEDLPWINVDPAQIKQVLLNLLHNAIQAMPKGGTLSVKTAPVERRGKEWMSISIADTGAGISEENLERIFEPFFTTRSAGQGTGLGLSVSYGIITEHGGCIEVESHPGQGSCFQIFLPVDSGKDIG